MTWTPTTTVNEWGQIRVVVGHKDVTFFRASNVTPFPTRVLDWQDSDPYGSNNANIRFTEIFEFEQIGTGEIDWLDKGKRVRIDHHDNNGTLVKNLFFGFIDHIEIDSNVGISVRCAGDLTGTLANRLHQPPIGRSQVGDAGDLILRELGTGSDGRGEFGVQPFTSGILLENHGDRAMTRLGFTDYVFGMAIKDDGSSLTILPDPASGLHAYTLGWRDLTTQHATVHGGAPGVKVTLSSDLADEPNAIYGEGVAPGGERWRNAMYPQLHNASAPAYPYNDGRSFGLNTTDAQTDTGSGITVMCRQLALDGVLSADHKNDSTFDDEVQDAVNEIRDRANMTQDGTVTPTVWKRIFNVGDGPVSFAGSMFWPLAWDKRTRRFLRSADGTITGLNPDYDHSILPVETFVAYGERVSKRAARKNARAMLKRAAGWDGTITLTSDPAEMSRFDLRAGMNIKVQHLPGFTGLLHISSVQVDWQSGTVSLGVSTQGRHYLDLSTRLERDRAARQDPGAHWRHMLRRSAQTSDAISGWEGESGAGIIRPTDLTGGTWNRPIPIVACELGTMGDLEMYAENAATTYYCLISATPISAAELNGRLGNPSQWADSASKTDVFTANDAWLVQDGQLMVQAWGTPDQPCGLGRKPYLNGDGTRSKWPVTGEQFDNGSWDFWTANDFLYLSVWPAADTTIRGRLRIQINEAS